MKNYELIPAGEVMARLLKKEEIFAVDLAVLVENYEENIPKSTCLWLKGLQNLVPLIKERPEMEYFEWTDKKGRKKRQAKWYMDALKLPPKERAAARSKTFKGIAKAMAEQWSFDIKTIKGE